MRIAAQTSRMQAAAGSAATHSACSLRDEEVEIGVVRVELLRRLVASTPLLLAAAGQARRQGLLLVVDEEP